MKVYKNKKKDDEYSNAEYLSTYDIVCRAIKETYVDIPSLQITGVTTSACRYSSGAGYRITVIIRSVRADLMEAHKPDLQKKIKSYIGQNTVDLDVSISSYNDIYLTFKK